MLKASCVMIRLRKIIVCICEFSSKDVVHSNVGVKIVMELQADVILIEWNAT